MKRHNIFCFVKMVAFFALLSAVLWKTYEVLAWKDTTGDYLSSMQQLYSTPKNTLDVVFLGSSHCYCGVLPCRLWEQYGIASFDMAVSGQDKSSTYHALLETLKTQEPKVVFVEMYGLCFDRHAVEGNEYRNMLSMRTSLNSVALVNEYVEPERRADFLLRWPIIHTRFWEVGKYDYIPYEPSQYGRGASFQWGSYEEITPGDYQVTESGTLTNENEKWLQRLWELKEDKGFEMVFFLMPLNVKREEQLQINAAKEFAAAKGIPFLDFNSGRYELGLEDDKDYIDNFHCNVSGALKVTDYIGQYLKEHYEVADHRGREEYSCWDKDLKWYYHEELADALAHEEAASAVARITSVEDIMSVISIDLEDGDTPEKYEETLRIFGLSASDIAQGGKWIYHNGELTKILENQEGQKEFCMDLSETDSLCVKYTGQRTSSDIMVNHTEYLLSIVPVTIVNYDMFLKRIVHSIVL